MTTIFAAWQVVHQWTLEANTEALANFHQAIELDPSFASAYALAARCYAQRKTSGWVTDRAHDIAEARRLARRATELGRDDAEALCAAGFAFADVVGEIEFGNALIDKALLPESGNRLVLQWLGKDLAGRTGGSD